MAKPTIAELEHELRTQQGEIEALRGDMEVQREQYAALLQSIEEIVGSVQENHGLLQDVHDELMSHRVATRGGVTAGAPLARNGKPVSPFQEAWAMVPQIGKACTRGVCQVHGESQLNRAGKCTTCCNEMTRVISERRRQAVAA